MLLMNLPQSGEILMVVINQIPPQLAVHKTQPSREILSLLAGTAVVLYIPGNPGHHMGHKG